MFPHLIVKAALTAFLAWAYTCFYRVSRKHEMPCGSKDILVKLTASFIYNLLLFYLLSGKNPDLLPQKRVLIFLSFLIADIDGFCTKIPTEFLIGYAAACLHNYWVNPVSVPFTVFLFLFLTAGICFYKKAGIGLYDLFFLLLTGSVLGNTLAFLLLTAEFLILWGIAGLLLRAFPSGKLEEKVPLSPLIVLAFCLGL